MKLGMYVVVDDMGLAKSFYRELFMRLPTLDFGDFVSFTLDGGIFALYAEKAYSHSLLRGNNAIPYIQVENIDREFTRVRELSPRMINQAVIDEGIIKLFMFTDPSGNAVEFFQITPAN